VQDRAEAAADVLAQDRVVEEPQHLGRAGVVDRFRLDRVADEGGERRGLGALAADVADDERPVTVDGEEVVEVAAHQRALAAGQVASLGLHARDLRQRARQQALLQRAGERPVLLRAGLRLLVQLRVVDGEAGAQPEVARQVEVGLRVAPTGLGHGQRQRAEHAAAGAQRDDDLGARADRAHQLGALLARALASGAEHGVLGDLGRELGLAGRDRGRHPDPLVLAQRAALAPRDHQRLALRVLVGDRHRPAAAGALEQLDLHVVGQLRHQHTREAVEPLVDAGRRVEHLAGA
jgi:hypothetical protein